MTAKILPATLLPARLPPARLLPATLLLASLAGGLATTACSDPAVSDGSGGTTGSGGASGDSTVPSDTSQAGIEAFLAAGTYKSAPWVFDATPRPSGGSTSPHGNVRVYLNPTAVASIEGGNNDFGDEPGNTVDSMAVKELYDTAGTQLGTAVMLRTAASGASADWIYYCSSTTSNCTGSTESGPTYGPGASDCSICHGGLFYAPVPP